MEIKKETYEQIAAIEQQAYEDIAVKKGNIQGRQEEETARREERVYEQIPEKETKIHSIKRIRIHWFKELVSCIYLFNSKT